MPEQLHELALSLEKLVVGSVTELLHHCWVPCCHRQRRNLAAHYRTGSNDDALFNVCTGKNKYALAEPHVVFDHNRPPNNLFAVGNSASVVIVMIHRKNLDVSAGVEVVADYDSAIARDSDTIEVNVGSESDFCSAKDG